MNDYIEVRFNLAPCDEVATDVLAAMLCEYDYESFVPDELGLTSYVKKELYSEGGVNQVIAEFPLPCNIEYKVDLIEGQDWNSEWEKNYFKPIVVKDKCVIHSSFHKDIPVLKYDIVIDPKMAFGTGHHATTSLIIEQLLETDLEGKAVVDMGTGTGILAILSHMKGANQITAIEIDPVAHSNAIENLKINNATGVNLILGDANNLSGLSGVDVLKNGSVVLLSGFYEEDIPVIMSVAEPLGLKYVAHEVKDNWSCLKLSK